jgi:murein DD-endopeptidase MepM/ murein hydrolase activator NlpD
VLLSPNGVTVEFSDIFAPMSMRFLGALLVMGLISGGCRQGEPYTAEPTEPEAQEAEILLRYGLPEADFTLHEGSIRAGQAISDILLNHGITWAEIAALEAAAEPIFPVRKLQAGSNYTLFCRPDTTGRLSYMVVETTREDYVVYHLLDSIGAYMGKKPVVIEIRQAQGVIGRSLSHTVAELGLPYQVSHRLSEIYAWTIDFFRLQQGDSFSIVFEEKYIDGEPAGIGHILASSFTHRETPYKAFRFETADGAAYYSETGESMRKAFLKAPLEYTRISSQYSLKRFHPVQKRWKSHLGTDYAAPTGTPIMSTADGEVVASEYGKYNGNFVKIRHNNTYSTQYLHMSKRAVKKGERVKQGQVIGYVGATGLASGPHVCYRFWKNGKQVDPLREELPRSEPLPQEYRAAFAKWVEHWEL